MLIQQAYAHVGYVTTAEEQATHSSTDFQFLLSPLQEPINIFIFIALALAVVVAYVLLKKTRIVMEFFGQVKERALSYYDLVPWMLRLSLGIALIGAGVSGVGLSPTLLGYQNLSSIQILLGFLLMTGLLLGSATVASIALYMFLLFNNFYILGNLDFLSAGLALLILQNARPGVDDLLRLPFIFNIKKLKVYAPLILRMGLGSAMVFLAVYEKILNPHLSAFVVEKYGLMGVIPVSPAMWVLGVGLIEFILGWLFIIGFNTRILSVITIIILSMSFFYFGEGVYSHVTLLGVLSALFVLGSGSYSFDSYKNKSLT